MRDEPAGKRRVSAGEAWPLIIGRMGASERALSRGIRRGKRSLLDLGSEVREARVAGGISQQELGRQVGVSGTKIGRIEAGTLDSLSMTDASKIAAVLGFDLSVRLYPIGNPLRDAGHTARLRRLLENVRPPLAYRTEVPLPQRPDQPTELRAWDAVLFGAGMRTGLELEMRLRDGQAVERRLAAKRRDDPVEGFLLLIADTKSNRRVLAENPNLFGDLPRLKTSNVLKELRAGQHPPTGLMLI